MSQLFLGPGPNTDEFNTVKSDIGIVEETDTATHNITIGQYVIWKNSLYTASAAISVGNTLSLSNLTAVSNGIANVLNDQVGNRPECKVVSVPNGSNTTFTFPKNSSFILQTYKSNSSDLAPNGLYIGQAHNTGIITPVKESSAFTISISGKVLTLSSIANNAYAIIYYYDN